MNTPITTTLAEHAQNSRQRFSQRVLRIGVGRAVHEHAAGSPAVCAFDYLEL
jgi:hypothetical protein